MEAHPCEVLVVGGELHLTAARSSVCSGSHAPVLFQWISDLAFSSTAPSLAMAARISLGFVALSSSTNRGLRFPPSHGGYPDDRWWLLGVLGVGRDFGSPVWVCGDGGGLWGLWASAFGLWCGCVGVGLWGFAGCSRGFSFSIKVLIAPSLGRLLLDAFSRAPTPSMVFGCGGSAGFCLCCYGSRPKMFAAVSRLPFVAAPSLAEWGLLLCRQPTMMGHALSALRSKLGVSSLSYVVKSAPAYVKSLLWVSVISTLVCLVVKTEVPSSLCWVCCMTLLVVFVSFLILYGCCLYYDF